MRRVGAPPARRHARRDDVPARVPGDRRGHDRHDVQPAEPREEPPVPQEERREPEPHHRTEAEEAGPRSPSRDHRRARGVAWRQQHHRGQQEEEVEPERAQRPQATELHGQDGAQGVAGQRADGGQARSDDGGDRSPSGGRGRLPIRDLPKQFRRDDPRRERRQRQPRQVGDGPTRDEGPDDRGQDEVQHARDRVEDGAIGRSDRRRRVGERDRHRQEHREAARRTAQEDERDQEGQVGHGDRQSRRATIGRRLACRCAGVGPAEQEVVRPQEVQGSEDEDRADVPSGVEGRDEEGQSRHRPRARSAACEQAPPAGQGLADQRTAVRDRRPWRRLVRRVADAGGIGRGSLDRDDRFGSRDGVDRGNGLDRHDRLGSRNGIGRRLRLGRNGRSRRRLGSPARPVASAHGAVTDSTAAAIAPPSIPADLIGSRRPLAGQGSLLDRRPRAGPPRRHSSGTG